jgi:hypothetical protein
MSTEREFGDPQTVELVLDRLCRTFEIPRGDAKTIEEFENRLRARVEIALQTERHTGAVQTAVLRGMEAPPKRAVFDAYPESPSLAEALSAEGAVKLLKDNIPLDLLVSAPSSLQILEECLILARFLMGKNKAYGDSALKPVRYFSTADEVEQIRVRMDDKLSRMLRGHSAGENPAEDFVGYYILLQIAEKRGET